jgi:hypothetical protein
LEKEGNENLIPPSKNFLIKTPTPPLEKEGNEGNIIDCRTKF